MFTLTYTNLLSHTWSFFNRFSPHYLISLIVFLSLIRELTRLVSRGTYYLLPNEDIARIIGLVSEIYFNANAYFFIKHQIGNNRLFWVYPISQKDIYFSSILFLIGASLLYYRVRHTWRLYLDPSHEGFIALIGVLAYTTFMIWHSSVLALLCILLSILTSFLRAKILS